MLNVLQLFLGHMSLSGLVIFQICTEKCLILLRKFKLLPRSPHFYFLIICKNTPYYMRAKHNNYVTGFDGIILTVLVEFNNLLPDSTNWISWSFKQYEAENQLFNTIFYTVPDKKFLYCYPFSFIARTKLKKKLKEEKKKTQVVVFLSTSSFPPVNPIDEPSNLVNPTSYWRTLQSKLQIRNLFNFQETWIPIEWNPLFKM